MSFSLPHNLYQEYIAGQKYAMVARVQANFDACINAASSVEQSLGSTNARLVLASPEAEGLVPAGGQAGQVFGVSSDGQSYEFKNRYELCEFYYFRHPTLKPGFQPAQGGLIEDAATLYPEAWEYLASGAGQVLCKTETEWQAMTTATWATLADGTKVGWDGIGGAPFFVQNITAKTLRLPDLRGMYAEAAGYDSLGVGGAHGDAVRNFKQPAGSRNYGGYPIQSYGNIVDLKDGPFYEGAYWSKHNVVATTGEVRTMLFDPARVIPIAAKNQPRAWGALACVYLGAPR